MKNIETAQTKRTLSLDEMLKLAERVEFWKYNPIERGFTLWGRYFGETSGIAIEVGERAASPWGGSLRYIEVSYGNLNLGEYPPPGFEQDDRLNTLFAHSIPRKIRQQGLAIVNKISE